MKNSILRLFISAGVVAVTLMAWMSGANAQVADEGWFTYTTFPKVTPQQADTYFKSRKVPTPTPEASSFVQAMDATASALSFSANEIADLANALNHDPKLIYDFVHNNIDYVPYFGVLKGAQATLIDRSGNDFDQAALMVELLRVSGYPAVFMFGEIVMPRLGLANWFGVDPSWSIISNVISAGGMPVRAANADDTMDVTRVFVKTTINGTDYVFDPAYKQYDYKNKINLTTATGYNRTNLLAAVNTGATVTTDYVQNLNEGALRAQLSAYANNLINTIRAQFPNGDIKDIIGGRSIQKTEIQNFQTALPLPVKNIVTWSDIPAQYYSTLRVQHVGIDKTFLTTEMIGKRLTMTYAVGDNHPELRLDGTLVASGNATTSGTQNNMVVTIDHAYSNPAFADQTVTYLPVSGATYAIVSDLGGGINNELIAKRQKILDETIYEGNVFTSEAVLGETLNVLGLTWLKEALATQRMMEQVSETLVIFHHKIGVMAQEGGYYIDVKLSGSSVLSDHLSTTNIVPYSYSSGGFVSALEHGILEQLADPNILGVSTIKIIQLNAAQGGKTFFARSSNFSSVKPQLVNYTTDQLSALQTLINAGRTVILPDNGQVPLNEWKGLGYISKQFSSGVLNLRYTIDGNYFGGYAATKAKVNTPYVQKSVKANLPPLTQQPISTPKAADPVDMATGSFIHDHVDLALGSQAPSGLAFSRHYLSNLNLNKKMLGFGWTHNYDIRLSRQSNSDPALGFRQPVDAAALITGALVAFDLMSGVDNIQGWATQALVQKWTVDQTINNSINVNMGPKVLTYIKLPDGTYAPPPGITTALIDNGNGTFSLKERFGTTMNFDAGNRISALVDIDGNQMSFTYTGDLLTGVTDSLGRSLALTYTGDQLSAVNDSTGRGVSFGYDAANNLISYTDPEGKLWQIGYDGQHRVTTLTNPENITTITNVYDTQGRVATQLAPRQGGQTATYEFYFGGLRNVEKNPFGKTTAYHFDEKGRTVAIENALGQKSVKKYDGQNQETEITDPRGNKTLLFYDGFNNLAKTRNALNKETNNVYDAQLRLKSVTDPLNHQTIFDYDARHHLTMVTDPLNSKVELTYYPNGLLQTTKDSKGVVTTQTYDAFGLPATVKTGAHPSVITQYDPIGRMLSLKDQVLALTSFQYDKRGLLLRKTDPLNVANVLTYDNAGRLISALDRKGQTIAYSYTSTDQIDTITYPDATNVKFLYDLHDRFASMTDALGTTTATYDDADRLKDYTNALGFKVSYEYDAAGNVSKLTYPDGKAVTYTYDELNRIKTVGNWLGQTATYTYDDAGRMLKLVNFNGTVTDFGYDNADRLTSLSNKKTDLSLISSYALTLDANGNRSKIVQDEPLAPVMNPSTTTYKYNTTKNRLTTVGSTAFTFDTEGQLSKKGSTVYAFDFEHRLATIGTGTSAVQFKYDGAGNRLKAIRGSTETRYIYDASGNLLAEANSANVITKYYIYGSGLLAMVNTTDNKIYCYHFNAIGSTVAMTDSAQAVVNKYAYTPFGAVTQTETVAQPLKYVGEYGVLQEPNGLYYMRARYYDPAVGRFISEDPIGFESGEENLYAYVANNPLIFVDPDGLEKSLNLFGDTDNLKFAFDSWREGMQDTINMASNFIAPVAFVEKRVAIEIVKHRKVLKQIVQKASKLKEGLPNEKIEQLKRVVTKSGGKVRTETGLTGTMKGKLHSQVEGLGSRTSHRHILHADGNQ